MKTVFIDCSPKKRLSASGFIAGFTAAFVAGKKKKEKLRTKADYGRVLEAVKDARPRLHPMPPLIICQENGILTNELKSIYHMEE